MTRRALLIINSRSRHGAKQADRATGLLRAAGFDITIQSAPHAESIPDFVSSALKDVDAVIAGGGDGTMNAVANGLVGSSLPLGVIPLGTANDLARTLGIPSSIPEACAIIAAGHVREIDLGWVNGKVFLNVASMGLTTRVTRELSPKVKRRLGVLAYPVALTRALRSLHSFEVEISSDGQTLRRRAVQVAVGNGRFFGGGMRIAHDAAIDDQRLDLYIIEARNAWELVRAVPAILTGRAETSPHVTALHGCEIEVKADHPRAVSMDGEIRTTTPALFRLLPRALRVFAPPTPATPQPGLKSDLT